MGNEYINNRFKNNFRSNLNERAEPLTKQTKEPNEDTKRAFTCSKLEQPTLINVSLKAVLTLL